MKLRENTVGVIGLSSVILFLASLLIFGVANNEFNLKDDYVSKLGARGEPNALFFNLSGFVTVGLLLFVFGLSYGRLQRDNLLSVLLSLFGLGFAFTAIPIDMQVSNSTISKAHIVAICLGLAFWLFGLSRLGYNQQLTKRIRDRANLTAIILVVSIIGFAMGLWSMPVTHRLVFGIVFSWTTLSSFELIYKRRGNETN
ncbi:MAG: DUF998 domain-containing protein [Saprospiraceae bacterium]|nr:DUF998 domain-containing protein [Saprospiraceae bacterium]